MKLIPTLVILQDQFCTNKKNQVSANITQTTRKNKLKIAVKVDYA